VCGPVRAWRSGVSFERACSGFRSGRGCASEGRSPGLIYRMAFRGRTGGRDRPADSTERRGLTFVARTGLILDGSFLLRRPAFRLACRKPRRPQHSETTKGAGRIPVTVFRGGHSLQALNWSCRRRSRSGHRRSVRTRPRPAPATPNMIIRAKGETAPPPPPVPGRPVPSPVMAGLVDGSRFAHWSSYGRRRCCFRRLARGSSPCTGGCRRCGCHRCRRSRHRRRPPPGRFRLCVRPWRSGRRRRTDGRFR
jgi:hypothetical protein